ncbi:uncharacterized protein METZ01_LOCUS298411 [marine metagenome]|uniref:Uncharacterized protein n=1 Tax=marine metagenome TaxID=408172 RepID=A0A382MCX3_9ZZZZ
MFLEHPNDTDNPQGYWAHGRFSIINSFKGIVAMLAGIGHGILPILFPFTTSTWIIRSFVKLVNSDRHRNEMRTYISKELIKDLTNQIKKG